MLSAQKQVWAKPLVAQNNSDQTSWWRKIALVTTAVCTKFLDLFLQTAALTTVLLRHQLFGTKSLGRLQIPTLDVSYLKISYKSYETFNACIHNLWVPTKYNYEKYSVKFLVK